MVLFKHDPGDCPVCGAKHTTCVSADYDPATRQSVTVVQVQREGGTQSASTSTPVTTATYRRGSLPVRRAFVGR